jgi:hypothetical protein
VKNIIYVAEAFGYDLITSNTELLEISLAFTKKEVRENLR